MPQKRTDAKAAPPTVVSPAEPGAGKASPFPLSEAVTSPTAPELTPAPASDPPCPACCHKTKQRSPEEYRALLHRLNRIEGQLHGIRGMLERSAYCTDILTQVAAVNAALNSFNRELLASHIRTCVTEDIREGKTETVEDLLSTLQRLMK